MERESWNARSVVLSPHARNSLMPFGAEFKLIKPLYLRQEGVEMYNDWSKAVGTWSAQQSIDLPIEDPYLNTGLDGSPQAANLGGGMTRYVQVCTMGPLLIYCPYHPYLHQDLLTRFGTQSPSCIDWMKPPLQLMEMTTHPTVHSLAPK